MSSDNETATGVKAMEEALNNVLVLERIIGFLPMADMRSCRLVNSTWLDAATAQLRKVKTNKLNINNAEHVQSFLELWGMDDENDERPYPPFTRIWFNLINMNCEEQVLNSFFKTVAPFLVELRLHVSLINPRYLFKDQGDDLRLSYPNLRDYYVTVEGDVADSDGLIYKDLICGILENAPNLRHLAYYYDKSAKYFHCLIDTLKERKSGQKKIKMTILTHGGIEPIEDALFSRMADELPELKLEAAHISGVGDGDSVFRFLEAQSESLKLLYIRHINSCFKNFGLPTLKKLETLHVGGSQHVDFFAVMTAFLRQGEVVPSADYAKQLPALKEIMFTNFDNDEWIQFMPHHGSPPVASVEVLKLPNVDRAVNLEHCIRIFPNLRILQIPATVVFANLVYEYLPQLEELILDTCDATNIDDIITGFSAEECDRWLRRLRFGFQGPEAENLLPFADGPMLQRPISVLKELKVLRLFHHPDKVELTKVSSLVLAKMESLQILDLSYRSSITLENFVEVIQDMEKAGKQVQYRESESAINDDDDDQSDDDGDDPSDN